MTTQIMNIVMQRSYRHELAPRAVGRTKPGRGRGLGRGRAEAGGHRQLCLGGLGALGLVTAPQGPGGKEGALAPMDRGPIFLLLHLMQLLRHGLLELQIEILSKGQDSNLNFKWYLRR